MASIFTRARFIAFSKYAAGAAIAVPAGFHLWTRQCFFDESFSPATDRSFAHPLLKKANPKGNPDFHDCCVRTLRFDEVRPELLADALKGGSKLVEAYSAGVWGRYAFAPQLKIMEKARKSEENKDDIWDKKGLLESSYEVGTIFADDFVVIDKTPGSITLRGGMSPRVAPQGPREMDTFVALAADLDSESRTATFRLKSVVVDGTSEGEAAPLGGVECFLHRQYAKLLVTAGVDHCAA
ncbi:hypothetical protein CMUS01_08120 [Colletotrichum musicola]|uniref:Uncharacterized protein n=1 Tax=Colletotrichum musicola TaxID=2175873 RepID=A0A8H6NED8_9PEZI|nr:hypothetical protein CMUS01_08120 [Colletotrichum musicola]